MPQATPIDMFKTEPEWLLALRLDARWEEMPLDLPLNYWHTSGSREPGVCCGHWIDPENPKEWVAILFEEGSVYVYNPYELFPAPKPEWVKGDDYKYLYGG